MEEGSETCAREGGWVGFAEDAEAVKWVVWEGLVVVSLRE